MFKPKPVFYVFLFGVLFWSLIFYFGFFQTVMWTIILSACTGIYLKLSE